MTTKKDLDNFLISKLHNFKLFMNNELNNIIASGSDKVTFEHIDALNKQVDFFIDNVNLFISFVNIMKNENDYECIKNFLIKYELNIDDFINIIDYNKLKRYIECFKETVNNI